MNWKFFQWRSLKTKITLFTLAIFLAGIWSMAFYSSRLLRADMQRLLSEQQFSTAAFVADSVHHELADRLRALSAVAEKVSPAMLQDRKGMQAFLEHRPIFHLMFNAGVYITGADGVGLFNAPLTPERVGIYFSDQDYIAEVLKSGRAVLGQPAVDKLLRVPMLGMAAPLRDERGGLIGVLVGLTDLSQANFLDEITGHPYGQTGGYVLVGQAHRQIISATDKNRLMEQLPAPGTNPAIDRLVQGEEGSAVFVNPEGVEVLASIKSIPMAGWVLNVQLPTREAFAPIHDMQRRMLVAAVFLTLLAGALMWWMLQRQLWPILVTARMLSTLADKRQVPLSLPVTRQDELGQLIGGFNRLLSTLEQRDAALKASEERLRCLAEMSSDFYWESDAEHRLTQRTESRREEKERVFRSNPSVGLRRWEIPSLAPDEAGWRAHREVLDAHLPFRDFEICRPRANGEIHYVTVSGDPVFDEAGHFKGYRGVGSDITERKRAEQELMASEKRLNTVLSGVENGVVTISETGLIETFNRAAEEMFGYTAAEVIGQNITMLMPEPFRAEHDGHLANYKRTGMKTVIGIKRDVVAQRKDGTVFPIELGVYETLLNDKKLFIGTISDISYRKQAEKQIEELAFNDQLTGLPNRVLLRDRMRQAMAASARSGSYGALLFIDLDHFKTLNDTLGHDMGDLLLQQAAQRLSTCVRTEDTVARLGGDEFVVLLSNLSASKDEAAIQTEAIGEKIRSTLGQTYRLNSVSYLSTPSIGATLFSGQVASLDDLLKQADMAMYASKAKGRNALHFFDPDMELLILERVRLESDLREAVRQNQFLLHYQAQVNEQGELTGVEVLVRWQHPARGLVSPETFISLAEETGLILPLGYWVLETACAQLKLWAGQPRTAHLGIAVNVSARQFLYKDFVDQVLSVLDYTGADPRKLKLELTESMLLDSVEETIEKMRQLKARGVAFSLDDFGTGYSSLSYLKRLPLNQLKIDRSFVRDVLSDPDDAAIARTIIALAQSLGLEAIAEGVETAEQRDFLRQAGCHAYQGYFFSRPLALADFEAFALTLDAPALPPGP